MCILDSQVEVQDSVLMEIRYVFFWVSHNIYLNDHIYSIEKA
jgi:hypothetical protein